MIDEQAYAPAWLVSPGRRISALGHSYVKAIQQEFDYQYEE